MSKIHLVDPRQNIQLATGEEGGELRISASLDAAEQSITTMRELVHYVVVPAIDTAIYAAGDAIGTVIALNGAVNGLGACCALKQITILDRANQLPQLNVLFFRAFPTAATVTNNAAFVFSTADLDLIARVPIVTADYVAINSKAVATINEKSFGNIELLSTDGALYVALVLSAGTPTFVAITDLQLRITLQKDY